MPYYFFAILELIPTARSANVNSPEIPDEPSELPLEPIEYPSEPSEFPLSPEPYEPNNPNSPEPEPYDTPDDRRNFI